MGEELEEDIVSMQQEGWEACLGRGCLDLEGCLGLVDCLDLEDFLDKGAGSSTATWEASLEESTKIQIASLPGRWLHITKSSFSITH